MTGINLVLIEKKIVLGFSLNMKHAFTPNKMTVFSKSTNRYKG